MMRRIGQKHATGARACAKARDSLLLRAFYLLVAFTLVFQFVLIPPKKAEANPIAIPLVAGFAAELGISAADFALLMAAIITGGTGLALLEYQGQPTANPGDNVDYPEMYHWNTPGWPDWDELTNEEKQQYNNSNYQYYLEWLNSMIYTMGVGTGDFSGGEYDPENPPPIDPNGELLRTMRIVVSAEGGIALSNLMNSLFANEEVANFIGEFYENKFTDQNGIDINLKHYTNVGVNYDGSYLFNDDTAPFFYRDYVNSNNGVRYLDINYKMQSSVIQYPDIYVYKYQSNNENYYYCQYTNMDYAQINLETGRKSGGGTANQTYRNCNLSDDSGRYLNYLYGGKYIIDTGNGTVEFSQGNFHDLPDGASNVIVYNQYSDTPQQLQQVVTQPLLLSDYANSISQLPYYLNVPSYQDLEQKYQTDPEIRYQDFVRSDPDPNPEPNPNPNPNPNPDPETYPHPGDPEYDETLQERFSRVIAMPFEAAFPFCLIEDARTLFLKLNAVAPEPNFRVVIPLIAFNVDGANEIVLDASDLKTLGGFVKIGFNILWVSVLIYFAYKMFLNRGGE